MRSPAPPRKALLLAAGFGTRIQPLSYDTPKPMMPLWGKPLIGHAIDLVKSWGVSEILVNAHHAPESLLSYCREQSSKSCRIQISFEPTILGTGGALKRADWFIQDGPFWMLNTDIAAELDPSPLLKAFHKDSAVAALWMHPSLGPRTVAMQGDRILDFASPTPGTDGTYTFCGLQLLSPRILEYLPQPDFCSVVDGYRNALRKRQRVVGIAVEDAFWADLGSRERYLAAHRDIHTARRRGTPGKRLLPPAQRRTMMNRIPTGTVVNGFAAVGKGISIGAGVTLENSVLWDGATVKRGTHITDSIAGHEAPLRGRVTSSAVVRCDVLPEDIVLRKALATLNRRGKTTEKRSPRPTSRVSGPTLEALPARGSDRSFERIKTPSKSGILIRYDDAARPENAVYASHSRTLQRHGLNVPSVLLDLPTHKATLFQDVGSTALCDVVPHLSARQCETLYKRVLDQLLLLHRIPRRATERLQLQPPFSPALYAWERGLFVDFFLKGQLRLEAGSIETIERELCELARSLEPVPSVLLHRDMQSSNVLLNGRELALIDFQGMRMGPAAYDVASLLCDPYVMLHAPLQEKLLAYYLAKARHRNAVEASYPAAAVQRLSQALGAFGRLSAIPGMRRFAEHTPPACKMMLRILENMDGVSALTAAASSALT